MSTDQPHNARRCVELGAARLLDPVSATPGVVREAVSEVLTDQSYRRAAEQIQAAYHALPGSDEAVALIEQLVN
jgi:UDP:flavonoid glycosyltransferase YjiC (YdhE family)